MSFRYDGALRSVPFMVGRELLVDKVKSHPPAPTSTSAMCGSARSIPTRATVWRCTWVCGARQLSIGPRPHSERSTRLPARSRSGRLSQVLDMLDVLNQGISAVLGLKDIQAHLNLYQEFHPDASGGESSLRPGYFVMIDAPRVDFDASSLRVIDGRLFVQSGDEAPRPMGDHSFVLYSIRAQTQLDVGVTSSAASTTRCLTR